MQTVRLRVRCWMLSCQAVQSSARQLVTRSGRFSGNLSACNRSGPAPRQAGNCSPEPARTVRSSLKLGRAHMPTDAAAPAERNPSSLEPRRLGNAPAGTCRSSLPPNPVDTIRVRTVRLHSQHSLSRMRLAHKRRRRCATPVADKVRHISHSRRSSRTDSMPRWGSIELVRRRTCRWRRYCRTDSNYRRATELGPKGIRLGICRYSRLRPAYSIAGFWDQFPPGTGKRIYCIQCSTSLLRTGKRNRRR
jgi:hypothetical protein